MRVSVPESVPERPDLSTAEVLLLRQVAGGHLIAAVSRATGIPEPDVTRSVDALLDRLGTRHRHRAAALGVGWGWVGRTDVPVLNPSGKALSARPREVLTGLVAGEATEETAARLGLAEATVRSYVQTIRVTLGVRSRPQAAARGLLAGIVPMSALGEGWPDITLGAVTAAATDARLAGAR
ncbi:helix-turn-helix transcriptional regulator [Kitasatospora sp. NPDC001603]|uniref:helix-turn-helix transcriptional regulator n=1 Tax=Kitasatospora sp. NPDC001603 TaxID=3154388 RepID=UPI00332CE928